MKLDMLKGRIIDKGMIIILVLSLLPLFSVFSTRELIHTHDGLVHLPRLAAYFKALSDGQIPPRFAGYLNYGYGMPLFIFIYHMPYIIGSMFLTLGFSLVNAFKLSLTLSYLLSGVFMFGFSKAFFKDNRKAILVSIFYQFATFRFVELLARGSFGEVYTYAFLPLALWGLVLTLDKKTYGRYLLTALATFFLILSHNSVSLVFFGALALFILFFAKTIKDILISFTALAFGLALSAFYWLPALLEHKYTYGDMFMKDVFRDHFPPLIKFFLPNFTNNEFFQIQGISVQFGLFYVLAIIIAGTLLVLNRVKDAKTRQIGYYSFMLIGIGLFFMQPISTVFWANISFLRQFQFPWRFLALTTFATSLLSVYFLKLPFFKKKLYFTLLLLLVVFSSVYYWKPVEGYDEIDEEYYWSFPLNTTYYGETDVIWSAGPAKNYPKNPVEIVDGEAEITNYEKKSQRHTYTVIAAMDSQIVDHTQYFPGWRVMVDDEKVPIEFQDPSWRGEITFPVNKGERDVVVEFRRSKIRLMSEVISVISGIGLIALWMFLKYRNH